MKLLLIRHLSGVDLSNGFRPYAEHWRKVGYQAIESSPRMVPDIDEFRRVLKGEGFAWVPQVFSNTGNGGGSVALHLSTLKEQIEECLEGSPLFLNVHSGSDAWTLNEAEDFYSAVRDLELRLGVICSHKTHRSRYFGNPWNTDRLLQRMPAIKLTADFSHWVCVAERLLADAAAIFSRLAKLLPSHPCAHRLRAGTAGSGPAFPGMATTFADTRTMVGRDLVGAKVAWHENNDAHAGIWAAALSAHPSLYSATRRRSRVDLRLDGTTSGTTLRCLVK
jgi:hypothetical protein